ncbi:hypothetical protein F7U66_18725 [Vibrio parahaemolyticus]|nr:hypothetical protein [Vibrio parahaemolyticus]
MNLSKQNADNYRKLMVESLKLVSNASFDLVIGQNLDVKNYSDLKSPKTRKFKVLGAGLDVDFSMELNEGEDHHTVVGESFIVRSVTAEVPSEESVWLIGRISAELADTCLYEVGELYDDPVLVVTGEHCSPNFGYTLEVHLSQGDLSGITKGEREQVSKVIDTCIHVQLGDGRTCGNFPIDLEVGGKTQEFICTWNKS